VRARLRGAASLLPLRRLPADADSVSPEAPPAASADAPAAAAAAAAAAVAVAAARERARMLSTSATRSCSARAASGKSRATSLSTPQSRRRQRREPQCARHAGHSFLPTRCARAASSSEITRRARSRRAARTKAVSMQLVQKRWRHSRTVVQSRMRLRHTWQLSSRLSARAAASCDRVSASLARRRTQHAQTATARSSVAAGRTGTASKRAREGVSPRAARLRRRRDTRSRLPRVAHPVPPCPLRSRMADWPSGDAARAVSEEAPTRLILPRPALRYSRSTCGLVRVRGLCNAQPLRLSQWTGRCAGQRRWRSPSRTKSESRWRV
jgi:hypothetical protein